MKIYLFKVHDYTTLLIGQYDKEREAYYVERGDGTKYYYEYWRVTWVQEIDIEVKE